MCTTAEDNSIAASADKTKEYRDVLEIVSQTTDDFLFLLDIAKDQNWFFGTVDVNYALRDKGIPTNTTAEMLSIVHPADRKALTEDLAKIVAGEKNVHDMDYRWINRSGNSVWVNCRGKVIRDAAGKPFVMIGRVSEEALRHLFNPLTGLWNHRRLMQDLKEEFTPAARGYFMLLDIDDLAAINLSHGREYGDALLCQLADMLEAIPALRKVYHTERNYFAVWLNVQSASEVQEIYANIQEMLIDKCTLSAGIVPMDISVFRDANSLYDSVKFTLRKAKNKGPNTLEFFSTEELEQKILSLELLEELQESVKNNFEGFEVFYQPQVKAGSYSLFSVEALIRYNSKTRGRVFPDAFIPILEQTKLIDQVGLWVLEQALSQCKEWRKSLPDLRVSVNFSTVQFEDPFVVEKIRGVLKATGMPGSALTAELTESVQLQEIEYFNTLLKQMKKLGVQIAIDDFGTGYSNLGYLKQIDVDEIKIDKVFVRGIEADTYNHKLISNIIGFAKANSIRVCCEGVEDMHELAVLEGLFPDLMQGYLFDKPCNAEQIEQSYVQQDTQAYAEHMRFVEKLYAFKEKAGIIRIDPKDILRETDVGLWIIRIDEKGNYYEMHADDTMERIMAVDRKFTPEECYAHWHDRIHPDYVDYVHENVKVMIEIGKVVQLQYPWMHPTLGEVEVRCNGRRAEDSDGMIVLEGYHRIISHIEGV